MLFNVFVCVVQQDDEEMLVPHPELVEGPQPLEGPQLLEGPQPMEGFVSLRVDLNGIGTRCLLD